MEASRRRRGGGCVDVEPSRDPFRLAARWAQDENAQPPLQNPFDVSRAITRHSQNDQRQSAFGGGRISWLVDPGASAELHDSRLSDTRPPSVPESVACDRISTSSAALQASSLCAPRPRGLSSRDQQPHRNSIHRSASSQGQPQASTRTSQASAPAAPSIRPGGAVTAPETLDTRESSAATLGRADSLATYPVRGSANDSAGNKDVTRIGHVLSGEPLRQSRIQRQFSELPTPKSVATGFQGLGIEGKPLSDHDAWESVLLQSLARTDEPFSAGDPESSGYHRGGSRGKWLCGTSGRELIEDTDTLAQSRSDVGVQESKLQAWLDELVADPHRLRCSGSEVPSGGWLLKKSRPQTWHVDFPEITRPPPALDSSDKVSSLVAQIEAEITADEEHQPEGLYPYSEAETVVDLFALDGVPTAPPEEIPSKLPWLLLRALRGDPASLKELSLASHAAPFMLKATVEKALEGGHRVRLLHALAAYLVQDATGFAFWAGRGYTQERQGLGAVAGEEEDESDDEASLDNDELYVWGPSAQGRASDGDDRSRQADGDDYSRRSHEGRVEGDEGDEGAARQETEEQNGFTWQSSGALKAGTDFRGSVVAAGFACALQQQLRALEGQLADTEKELWRELSSPSQMSLRSALEPGAEMRRSERAGTQGDNQVGGVGVPGAGRVGVPGASVGSTRGAGPLFVVMRLEEKTEAVRQTVEDLWYAACELMSLECEGRAEAPRMDHEGEGEGESERGGLGARERLRAGLEEHLRASLDSWARGVWYTRGTREAFGKFMRGAALLSRLYELLVLSEIGSAWVNRTSPLRTLFEAALRPYLGMVHHWLTTGDMGPSDPHNEFLLPVGQDEDGSQPRKVATPSFLRPVAREIETGGSQMALLMSSGAGSGTPPAHHAHRVAHQASRSQGGSDMGSDEGGLGSRLQRHTAGVPDAVPGPQEELRVVRHQLAASVGRLLSPMGCGEQALDACWSEYLVAESGGREQQKVNGACGSVRDSSGAQGPVSDRGPIGAPLRCGLTPPMLEVAGTLVEQAGTGISSADTTKSSVGAGIGPGTWGDRRGVPGERRGIVEEGTGEASWREFGGNRRAGVDDWLRASVFLPLQEGLSTVNDFLVSWPQVGDREETCSTAVLPAPSESFPLVSLSSPGMEGFLTYGQHCELLRRFFFLEAAPAALPGALLEALRCTTPLDLPSSSSGSARGGGASEGVALQQAIQRALETSLDPSDPLLSRITLRVSPAATGASSGNATLDALARVSFFYHATWPSSLLLTPQVLAPYNALLRLLLSISHARETLKGIDDAVAPLRRLLVKERQIVRGEAKGGARGGRGVKEAGAEVKNWARTVEVCSQALHRIGVFRFTATGALNSLHTYLHHAATSASQAAQAQASGGGSHRDVFSIQQAHREHMESWCKECGARVGEIPRERLWELQRIVGACTDLDGLEAIGPRIGDLCKWRPKH